MKINGVGLKAFSRGQAVVREKEEAESEGSTERGLH
jgi:hypothetical protein